MKITTKILIVVGIMLGLATTTYAVKSKTVHLPVDADSYIVGNQIDSALESEHMTIIRFIDGKNTCYTVVTKVNDNKVNTAISCVK